MVRVAYVHARSALCVPLALLLPRLVCQRNVQHLLSGESSGGMMVHTLLCQVGQRDQQRFIWRGVCVVGARGRKQVTNSANAQRDASVGCPSSCH